MAGHANDERRKIGVSWRVGMAGSHRKNRALRFCFTALPAAMSKYSQIGSFRTQQIESKRRRTLSCYRMWQRFNVKAINAPTMNAITRSTIKITMRIRWASSTRSGTTFRHHPSWGSSSLHGQTWGDGYCKGLEQLFQWNSAAVPAATNARKTFRNLPRNPVWKEYS